MGLVLDAGLFTGPQDKAFPSVFLVSVIFLVYGFLVWLSFCHCESFKVHLYHIFFGLKFSRLVRAEV